MTIFTDHDDTTRTVTTYDEAGVVTGTRPYTADENAAADAALADAATLDDLATRVARIETHLWPAPAEPTTPDDPTVSDWTGIWPDGGPTATPRRGNRTAGWRAARRTRCARRCRPRAGVHRRARCPPSR